VVNQRLGQLLDSGLLVEDGHAASTGGRAAREIRFRADAGYVLVAQVDAGKFTAGIADLDGRLLVRRQGTRDDAEAALAGVPQTIEAHFDGLLAAHPGMAGDASALRGICIALPGNGDPVSLADCLSRRYGAPATVDDNVRLVALAELRSGVGRGESDFLYVDVGDTVAAALVSGGRLHRGFGGAAGDLGHVKVVEDVSAVCHCGGTGCLELVAGGVALRGEPADSPRGVESAQWVGRTLAPLVMLCAPAVVVLGGDVVRAFGASYLAEVRDAVSRCCRPMAIRDLRITGSSFDSADGALRGAALRALDGLFSRGGLAALTAGRLPRG
jgi:predicted NBD/HSP70 family sugar kinase